MTDDQIIKAISNPEPSPPSLGGNKSEIQQKPGENLGAKESKEVGVGSSASKEKDAGNDARKARAEEKSKTVLEEAVNMVLDVSDVSEGETSPCQTLHAKPELDYNRIKPEVPFPISKETSRHDDGEGEGGRIGDGGEERGGGKRGRDDGGGVHIRVDIEQEEDKISTLAPPSMPKVEEEHKNEDTKPHGERKPSVEIVSKFDLNLLHGATEAAEMLEMKLRRRALESELRRSKRNKTIQRERAVQQAQAERAEEEVVASRGQTTNSLRNQSSLQE